MKQLNATRHGTYRICQKAVRRCGLVLMRPRSIPFGVDWRWDIRYLARHRGLRIAFDIGANEGQTAIALAESFPLLEIHSFEPVAATFQELTTATSRLENVHLHHLGLAEVSGEMAMLTGPQSGHSRLIDLPNVAADASRVETVPITTVDEFCVLNQISTVDLLKIDVEGAELRVLEGAQETLRDRGVRFVLAECDFIERRGEPHARFWDLFDRLSSEGFKVVSFYSQGVDEWGRRWGDVLFRRPECDGEGEVATTPFA